MIDHLDKQTQPMDLQQKRGRGRPVTGKALSNADRQRAYRERQKAQRNEIERELHNAEATLRVDESYTEGVWQELEQARARIVELEKELNEAHLIMADQAIRTTAHIQKLKSELASRNEKEITEGKFPGTWVLERKERGAKSWKKSGGVPESNWDEAKGSVDYMQFKSGTGQDDSWRARCTDGDFKGMIYWPKAPK